MWKSNVCALKNIVKSSTVHFHQLVLLHLLCVAWSRRSSTSYGSISSFVTILKATLKSNCLNVHSNKVRSWLEVPVKKSTCRIPFLQLLFLYSLQKHVELLHVEFYC